MDPILPASKILVLLLWHLREATTTKRNGKAHKKGNFVPWHKWSKMIKEEKTKHHNSRQTEQRATSQMQSQDSKDPAAKANSAPIATAGTAFGGRAAMAAQNAT